MAPGATRPFHERSPVLLFRGVLVVGAAEEADPVHLVQMRSRESVGHAVPQEILCLAQLVSKRAAGGELNLESFLAQRRDDRPVFLAPHQDGYICGESRRD